MLVLTRRKGEKLLITFPKGTTPDDVLEVVIADVSRDRVRVGLTAPSHIKILRSEVEDETRNA